MLWKAVWALWIGWIAIGWGSSTLAFAEPRIALPNQLVAPTPLVDGTGKYFCPYTSDGVLTEWVDKAIDIKIGAQIGGLVGAELANRVIDELTVVGSLIGKKVGEQIGTQAAIKAIGGMDYIKNTSDLSFATIEDMALYLYVKHASHKHYKAALEATVVVYPELAEVYYKTIVKASEEAFAFEVDLSD